MSTSTNEDPLYKDLLFLAPYDIIRHFNLHYLDYDDPKTLEQVRSCVDSRNRGYDMPYYNVTAHVLYQSCLVNWVSYGDASPLEKACSWVEAENTFEIWKIIQKWFDFIENDDAINKYPDPYSDVKISIEMADKVIKEIDEDFMLEKSRFQGRLAPEFSRLPNHSRIAFIQEVSLILKTMDEIKSEAIEKVKSGELVPPPILTKK